MADERNPLGEAGQGLMSGVVGNNPITLLANAGIDVANLGIAAYGYFGSKAGLFSPSEAPDTIDKAKVPMTSEHLRAQFEDNPESGYGLAGNVAGGFLSPGNWLGGVRKLIAGSAAKKAPPAGSEAWFRGNIDPKPRWEINDQYAQMKGPLRPGQETVLSQVLDHPELYDNYPAIKYLRIKAMAPAEAAKTGKGGKFENWGAHGNDPETGVTTVFINPNLSPAEQRSTLLHEVQHNLQHKEQFTGGGSSAAFKNDAEAIAEWANSALKTNDKAALAKIETLRTKYGIPVSTLIDSEKLSAHIYNRLGGEIEARAVQKRADMSKFERGQTAMRESQDAAPLDWASAKKEAFGGVE